MEEASETRFSKIKLSYLFCRC